MKIQAFIFSFVLTLFSCASIAGSDHDHGHGHSHEPVSQQQAEQVAGQVLSTLVDKEVIDSSWKNIETGKSEKKEFGGNLEWVVSYKNEAVSDPGKQTLYIFLTLSGEYLAANYTGE